MDIVGLHSKAFVFKDSSPPARYLRISLSLSLTKESRLSDQTRILRILLVEDKDN